jgi:hypothetical protein
MSVGEKKSMTETESVGVQTKSTGVISHELWKI